MGKSYKEELAEFKKYRLDPENSKRIYPKARKLKPYKVYGIFENPTYGVKELLIGRYATAKDAKKAMKAAEKYKFYKEIKCDPPITDA